MRIRHRIETPDMNEVKEKVVNYWVPVIAGVIGTVVIVRLTNRPAVVIVNKN